MRIDYNVLNNQIYEKNVYVRKTFVQTFQILVIRTQAIFQLSMLGKKKKGNVRKRAR